MNDTLDRISLISKNIKSSEYLYGIKPCHFANITYKGAIEEKIRLAKDLRLMLIEIIENNNLKIEPKVNEEYSEYQRAEMRLNAIEKAIEFNEFLLKELEKCKG